MKKGVSTKALRTFATYTALSIGVVVGGVVIGAMVIAPAVSRAKPLMQSIGGKSAANSGTAKGSIAKSATDEPVVAEVAPFKPMVTALQAEAIADSAEKLVRQFAAQPKGIAAVKANATRLLEGSMVRLARVPKATWLYVDLGAVLLVAALVLWRRRSRVAPLSSAGPSVASTPVRSMSGKASRTPRAVVALAESGASPADIARRTRMPLDAVAMCLSMGSMGARQLQPPTA